MVVHGWMCINQDWGVCACARVRDSDGLSSLPLACVRVSPEFWAQSSSKHIHAQTCQMAARRNKSGERTPLLRSLQQGWSCHFVLIRQNLSLSSAPVAFVLTLRHHSHLLLSHSLYFPSCSLRVYLSPLMRRFLIKSSSSRDAATAVI